VTRSDVLNLAGAAAASFCVTILLFGRLAAFSGLIGFLVVFYLAFVAVYAVLVSLSDDGPAVRDKIATAVLWSIATLVMVSLVWIILFTLIRGWAAVHHTNFFSTDLSQAGPLSPLTVGGLEHAMVGTLWMIGIALVLTVPLGLACAVYLNEVGGRLSRFVRTITVAMTALPSIVAGLFIYIAWIVTLRFEHSGLAAALALSVMMLPIIIRAADLVLRLVPGNLREASLALGAPTWRTVWHVVLPTARSGLATAVILGTARGVGETSPVLLTAGYTTYLNTNPLHGPMVSLPLAAFELVSSGVPTLVSRGFGAAAFLLLIVLILFVIARLIGGRGPAHLSRRQVRRIRRQSARDLNRLQAGTANQAAFPNAVALQ
jgi:phosphate transport system permease protein